MHTIKFRGKSISTGEWVYGYYVYCAREVTIDTPVMEHRIYTIGGSYFVVDPTTVGQYTGMTETAYVGKTTKEIYEGDVLKYGTEEDGYREGLIGYEEGKYGGYGLTLDNYDYCPAKNMLTKWKDVEIIGNIHDNPTLLTQQGE